MSLLVTSFFVSGLPQPGGSKRAFMPEGARFPVVTDDNPKAKDWKATVRLAAAEAYKGAAIDGPLVVDVAFFVKRPAGHYGKKGLLPSAPRFPQTKPDATKLWRSTEDALTGILWTDDARIVSQRVTKLFADNGRTGVRVALYEATAEEYGSTLYDRDRLWGAQ